MLPRTAIHLSLRLATAVTLMSLASVAAAEDAPNLLTNPDFTAGYCRDYWDVRPAPLANIICSRGNGFVWLNYNNQGEDPQVTQGVHGLVPGTTYRITARWQPGPDAHAQAPGATAFFAIGVNGDFQGQTFADEGDGWTTSVREFVASDEGANIAFAGEFGSDDDVLLDRVSMMAVSQASNTFDGTDFDYLRPEHVTVATTAPASTSGPMHIGLRLNSRCDNDMFNFPRYVVLNGHTLLGRITDANGRTDFGLTRWFDETQTSGPYFAEVVVFDVGNMNIAELKINFSGPSWCLAQYGGEFRVLFGGQIYSMPLGDITYGFNNRFDSRFSLAGLLHLN